MPGPLDGVLGLLGGSPAPQQVPASDPVWQIPAGVQRQRDADRLALLQSEAQSAKDPASQAALGREMAHTRQSIGPQPLDGALSILNGTSAPQAAQQAPAPVGSVGAQMKGRIVQDAEGMRKDIAGGNIAAPGVGLLEGAANTVTGLGSAAAGGLAGGARFLYNLASGEGVQKSADLAEHTLNAVQQAGTYQPRTNAGKLVSEIVAAPGAALHEMGSSLGGDVGQLVGGQQGRIAGQAVGGFLPDAAGVVAGGRGALNMARGGAIPAAAAPAQDASAAGGLQSVGAAASKHSSVAAAEGATPAVQSAIQQAEASGNVHHIAAQRHIEASSLPVPVELTAGQATGDVNLLSQEKNARGKYPELAQRFNAQNGQLAQNLDAIRDAAAPDVFHVDHVEGGDSLINTYKAKDAALSSDISAKYKALEDANGGSFPVDGQAFVKAADAALAQKMKSRYVPPEIAADMAAFREGAPMSFADFENMRTNLAAEARKAERSGDGNRAMATSMVRDALESLPLTGDAAGLKPLADAARSAARARFELINSDPAYKAAINDSVPADRFINKFVINAPVKDVQTMKANLAHDPQAAQTISAGAVNYLKDRAMRSGTNFSQAGFNTGLKALRPKLGDLVPPEQAGQLEKLGNVARYTQEQPTGSYVNNSNTAVSVAADAAKGLALGALDVKTMGASKVARTMMQKHAESKAVQKTLAPGAGVKISDMIK